MRIICKLNTDNFKKLTLYILKLKKISLNNIFKYTIVLIVLIKEYILKLKEIGLNNTFKYTIVLVVLIKKRTLKLREISLIFLGQPSIKLGLVGSINNLL